VQTGLPEISETESLSALQSQCVDGLPDCLEEAIRCASGKIMFENFRVTFGVNDLWGLIASCGFSVLMSKLGFSKIGLLGLAGVVYSLRNVAVHEVFSSEEISSDADEDVRHDTSADAVHKPLMGTVKYTCQRFGTFFLKRDVDLNVSYELLAQCVSPDVLTAKTYCEGSALIRRIVHKCRSVNISRYCDIFGENVYVNTQFVAMKRLQSSLLSAGRLENPWLLNLDFR
jgi:hypothetical protein